MKPMPVQIRDAVRAELGLTLGGLMTWNGTYSFRARHILSASLHCAGLSQREVARFMRRDPSTVQHSCRWMAEHVAELSIARKCVESLGFSFDVKRISVGFPAEEKEREGGSLLKEKSPPTSPSKENTPPSPKREKENRAAASPAAKSPKSGTEFRQLQRQVIAWYCEEHKAVRRCAYSVPNRDPRFVETWIRSNGMPEEAWFRETARKYLRCCDDFLVGQSQGHALWWLLDSGLNRFGAAVRVVTVQEAIAKFEAEHAKVRDEERGGDHGTVMNLFGRGAFEAPGGGAEADRIARERQIAAMKARGATS